jgi:hypothetical protein
VVTHAADLLALFMGNKKCRLKRKLFEQAGAVHEALRLVRRDIYLLLDVLIKCTNSSSMSVARLLLYLPYPYVTLILS